MQTVTNKTRAPLRVPLPRGKALHLGPGKSGQIRDEDASYAPLKKLVEAGQLAIFDGGKSEGSAAGSTTAPHEATHGLGKANFRQRKGGDR
ncbi:MAG: hypothetical protein ACRD3V_24840 [Vicinamibacteria bacterium]